MAATNDLDLSSIDSSNQDELASKIEGFYKQDSSQKTILSYHWERNHLMLDGHQWLVFEGNREAGGSWKRLQPSPANEYIPRPVTNYLFDAYQTLKGYTLKNKPRSTIRPNTQSHQDKNAAKIGELVIETNWEALKEDDNYEYAASVLLTYGTVFKKDYWDNSSLMRARIPRMQQQPKFDPQTGQMVGMQEVPVLDEQGIPQYDELPLGDVNTAIIEPYRMTLDPLAMNLHEVRWIMEYAIRPISWIKENYNQQADGYTGRTEEVVEEKSLSSSLKRFYNLKVSAGVRGNLNGASGITTSASDSMVNNAAVVKEYYERPTEKYPKGRLIVVANNIPLFIGDSPYDGTEQGDWHPYSECRWEKVPGRFWGKSPFDDAVEIQKQINSIDSVIMLARKTMAVPQKLVPHGSVAPGIWTGMPGQQIPYKIGPEGTKPELLPAMGVDAQVFQERAQKVEDIKQITGAVDILKGDRPPGVTAASALAILVEVATGKLGPALDRWKRFTESSQKKQLKIIAVKYREPRPEFIKLLLSKNRELTEDQIKSFIGEDLYDNCNVIIESASSIPKLLAAEHALLLELSTKGILNLEDPANKQEFLQRLGIIGFDSGYNKDVKRAEWENDLLDNLMNAPENIPVVLDIDNHDIHIKVLEERMKEPSFMSLPEDIQQAFFEHRSQHQEAKDKQMQMQMIQAQMMGMPAQPQESAPGSQPEKIKSGAPVSDKTMKLMAPEQFGPGKAS